MSYHCKGCGAPILWRRIGSSWVPTELDGTTDHRPTCPKSKEMKILHREKFDTLPFDLSEDEAPSRLDDAWYGGEDSDAE